MHKRAGGRDGRYDQLRTKGGIRLYQTLKKCTFLKYGSLHGF